MLPACRRGCIGQFERRKGGRERPSDRLYADTKSIARFGIELGIAQGVEQDWRGLSADPAC